MNYKDLFIKYMAYLDDVEGSDFIENGMMATEIEFTKDEINSLEEISVISKIMYKN